MSHDSDLRRRGQQQQQDEGGNEKREERQPLEWKQGGDGGGGGGGGNGNGGDGGEGASTKNDDTEETKKVQCVCVYHRSLLCNVHTRSDRQKFNWRFLLITSEIENRNATYVP